MECKIEIDRQSLKVNNEKYGSNMIYQLLWSVSDMTWHDIVSTYIIVQIYSV